MRRFVDPFIVALLAMLAIGLLVPIPEEIRAALDIVADIAIVVLFFLYGARLATREVLDGLRNARLQGAALATTFVLFPLMGLAVSTLAEPLLGENLADGVLYLSLLPSTVQSSVALVGVARGNVAGAITSATVSNLLGMLLTPLLVLVLMHTSGSAGSSGGIRSVLLLLLLPFLLGQLAQPLIGGYVRSKKHLTTLWDRGTILLVVLVAVSTATASGIWSTVSPGTLAAVVLVSGAMLAVALAATWWGGKALGLSIEDRAALLMCGSQKSLATGLPMLAALFPAAIAGPIAVPVIVFHQLQLIVSSTIARRLSRRPG
ncbi:bile acid:sodium symporter family protein [Pseudactinotalea suaedae]|uniref:bile acid:sodium symporter family protein n=1 Tax=Pseudactinotalea suaedae TaxID=1524924 RepID=UPI001F4F1118|nr:bile acid:sodium symporter family protein [Pseudactinotalea suaedae]